MDVLLSDLYLIARSLRWGMHSRFVGCLLKIDSVRLSFAAELATVWRFAVTDIEQGAIATGPCRRSCVEGQGC